MIYMPGPDLAPPPPPAVDTQHLLVLLERDMQDDAFFRYAAEFGEGVNYLPSIASAFLRLHSPDTDGRQIQAVRALPGVIWADYNTRTMRPQYTPSDVLALDNSAIYNELDLPTAWNITKGDPRIKIGVTDTGCDLRHPDINAQSGGVFVGGIHISSTGFPIKIDLLSLFRTANTAYGYVGFCVVAYDPNRVIPSVQQASTWVTVPVYTDSTCKTVAFQDWTDTQFTGWINQPVDIVMRGWINEITTEDHWECGIGRFEMYDGAGHGTACTGIIAGKHDSYGLAGVAPDCTTIHYKCTSDHAEYIDDLALIPALDRAVSDGCHIISSSLASTPPALSYISAVMQACYNRTVASGVLWFCAASNSGDYPAADVAVDNYGYPASWPGAFSIGACGDKAGAQTELTGYVDDDPQFIDYSRLSYFTQKNDKVFGVAPGFGYLVHAPINQSFFWRTRWGGMGSRYYVMQRSGGTSWATPAMAGVGGLMLSKAINPYSTTDPVEVKAILNTVCNRDRVKSILTSTANPTVKLTIGGNATVGRGVGRLRAGAAVAAV